jgi:endoplasmic reticulum resident protein 44
MHPPNVDILAFRPNRKTSVELDETFKGNIENFEEVLKWVQSLCVPLVREITFENAEELTEEGLPFLILFHGPDDKDSVRRYNQVVHEELIDEKRKFFIILVKLELIIIFDLHFRWNNIPYR